MDRPLSEESGGVLEPNGQSPSGRKGAGNFTSLIIHLYISSSQLTFHQTGAHFLLQTLKPRGLESHGRGTCLPSLLHFLLPDPWDS
jgi:hypothetical protein